MAAFPVELVTQIQKRPEDFRLLQRIPATREHASFPMQLNSPAGDEECVWFVDVETTGLDAEVDNIIELGIVRGTYSPSERRLTSIEDALSAYEDPLSPIPEVITALTGISDDDVAGKSIDDSMIESMLGESDPLIIAHNAGFDRNFIDRRFACLKGLRWGCTVNEIPWRDLGYEGRGLEYLLLRMGWFFDGHRAATDCLATAWMLAQEPKALTHLLDAISNETTVVRAFGAPFEVKDQLKSRGYRWHPGDSGSNKCWWKEVSSAELSAEQEWLRQTYHNGAERAAYERRDARTRHANPVT